MSKCQSNTINNIPSLFQLCAVKVNTMITDPIILGNILNAETIERYKKEIKGTYTTDSCEVSMVITRKSHYMTLDHKDLGFKIEDIPILSTLNLSTADFEEIKHRKQTPEFTLAEFVIGDQLYPKKQPKKRRKKDPATTFNGGFVPWNHIQIQQPPPNIGYGASNGTTRAL